MNKPAQFPIAPSLVAQVQAARTLSPERQTMLDATLAQIDAAFPAKPNRAAAFFERAIARGEPVLIVSGGRAMSFNEERGA